MLSAATPVHDEMRTPIRDRAWNPCVSMCRRTGNSVRRPCEAPTPRFYLGHHILWAPSPYLPSIPGQPMTPSSASYLPNTTGGQPVTPSDGNLDVMSPTIGVYKKPIDPINPIDPKQLK
ncbi:hypothetical protein Syun_009906 [Stephania yunnanensis]|uniref:Uncharacterized protein n=1 Tax=Stephania yunnanensis TaxID=152371 RepID=A0AAP0PPH1_9MAGN